MNVLDRKRLFANIDLVADYDFSNNKVFGSAYIVCQGELVMEKCYGVASLKSKNPITGATVFRLASMTKPITAVAAMILAERGLISLDDTVDKYLPEFKNIKIKDTFGSESFPNKLPTIKNILTHTSGMGSNPDKLATMTVEDKKTLDSVIAFCIKSGLDFEPGTKQMYSGMVAFDVLTKIIEIVSKTDYLSFLKKEIFEPCEMCDTTFVPTPAQIERTVQMHDRTDGENTEFKMIDGCVFECVPCTHYLGGAGLVSTLNDYCKFAKMLASKGKAGGCQILSEQTFSLICTPQVSEEIMPGLERWGLGVRVITDDAYPYLPKGTFGWSGAYGSHFWVDPTNNIIAVFMKNSKVDGGSANESARNFEKAVYSSFENL